MAYSTILLPQIMNVTDNVNITASVEEERTLQGQLIVNKEEASWIASLVAISTPLGSVLAGPLMDRFGRKKNCIFTTIPFIVSWILVVLTNENVYTIYAARLLAGVGGGLSTSVIVYVSEISHPSIRPMLLSLTSVFVSFGILLTLLLNYFFAWKIVAACCGGLAVFSLITLFFIPESPSWIVGVCSSDDDYSGGLKKAEKILQWLYKNPEDYEQEYNALVKVKEEKTATKEVLFENNVTPSEITIKSPQAWKPLLILFFIFVLQQFSGVYIIIFYAVQIFEKAGSVEMDKFTIVVILGIIRFFMAVVSVFLSRNFGRRPLLFSSGIGMGVSVLFAGLWIAFSSVGLAPAIGVLSFVLFASLGVMVIPWTLMGELLPLKIRGKGSGFMVAVAYVCMFLTVKVFITVLDNVGIVYIFIFFSIISFVFVIFVYLKVPETLGKTFKELEDHFK